MSIKARVAYCDKFDIHNCIFSIPFLQVHPGRFRGVCPFGSYPLCCRLPANLGHWHGYYAGKLLSNFVSVMFFKLKRQKWLIYIELVQERITTTKKGSITSVQAIYVPADDLTDPAPATTFAHLDATTVLSRAIAELGIYPAVDPLDSTSRKSIFWEIDAHSKLALVGPECVLGHPRLAQHSWLSPWFYVVPKATHEVWRALEGHRVSSKSPLKVQDEGFFGRNGRD